jgi:CHAD domain-containing protein
MMTSALKSISTAASSPGYRTASSLAAERAREYNGGPVPGLQETLEREVKLTAERGFRLPELPGTPLEARVFTSTYFDTDDHRLARAGVTLRRRVERGRGVWQLKLPRGAARLELEAPGGPSAPPPDMLDLLTAFRRGEPLQPVAKLRTHRTGVRVTNGGGPVADVTVDLVAIMTGRRVARSFREIEAELVNGSERALRRIEVVLRDAGARDGDGRPKVFQALDLEPPAEIPTPARDAPAGEHLTAMLRRQERALLAHDPGTRLGTDAEQLHQMRVATRRLRAYLRAARPLLDPDWDEALRSELAWLGGALGPVRDLDVLIEHLRVDASGLEPREQRALRRIFDLLEDERRAARQTLLEALRGERYLALLDRLGVAVAEPALVESSTTIVEIAAAEFDKLRKHVKRLGTDPTGEELHDVRIRGKRARYAAELAEASAGKRASRFIREAKAFQEVLGEHQDAVVAEARIRTALTQLGGEALAFAAGRLVERQDARRRAARAAFPDAWARLARRGKEAWHA